MAHTPGEEQGTATEDCAAICRFLTPLFPNLPPSSALARTRCACAGQSIRAMKQAVRDMQSKLSTPHVGAGASGEKGRTTESGGVEDGLGFWFSGASLAHGVNAGTKGHTDSDLPAPCRAPRRSSGSEDDETDFARAPSAGELFEEAARAYALRVLPLGHQDSLDATPPRSRSSMSARGERLSRREARIRESIRADEDEDEDEDREAALPKGAQSMDGAKSEPSPGDTQRAADEDRKLARQLLIEAR